MTKSKIGHYAKTTLLVDISESKMDRSKVTIVHSIIGSTAVRHKDVITIEPRDNKDEPETPALVAPTSIASEWRNCHLTRHTV